MNVGEMEKLTLLKIKGMFSCLAKQLYWKIFFNSGYLTSCLWAMCAPRVANMQFTGSHPLLSSVLSIQQQLGLQKLLLSSSFYSLPLCCGVGQLSGRGLRFPCCAHNGRGKGYLHYGGRGGSFLCCTCNRGGSWVKLFVMMGAWQGRELGCLCGT